MRQVVVAVTCSVVLTLGGFGSLAMAHAVRGALPQCAKGRIDNIGTATYRDCIVSGNSQIEKDGGGIINSGKLTLINVTIENNSTSIGNGGGIYNDGGQLIGNNVTFVDNSAPEGKGGALFNAAGTVWLKNSTFKANSAAAGAGGAVYNQGRLSNERRNNARRTQKGPGSITLKGDTLTGNSAAGGDGGAIYNDVGTVIIEGTSGHAAVTTISGNTVNNAEAAGDGGGIYNNGGTVEIRDAVIVRNNAGNGGGLFDNSGTTAVQDSAIVVNGATTDGGGVYLSSGSSLCCGVLDGTNQYSANLTVARNTAGRNGGGIYNDGGSVSLEEATIGDNSAGGLGGGIANGGAAGTDELQGVILARNKPANCNLGTSLADDGYNLDTGNSCRFTNARGGPLLINVSKPKLDGLKRVGRFLWGEKLLRGSPAIDVIPVDNCTVTSEGGNRLASDEFDTARPQGAACDVGAYEKPAASG